MCIRDSSYNGVEDSIAQEFQPFVVDGTSFFGAHGDGFMQQSLLLNLDVAREEAENSVKTKKMCIRDRGLSLEAATLPT